MIGKASLGSVFFKIVIAWIVVAMPVLLFWNVFIRDTESAAPVVWLEPPDFIEVQDQGTGETVVTAQLGLCPNGTVRWRVTYCREGRNAFEEIRKAMETAEEIRSLPAPARPRDQEWPEVKVFTNHSGEVFDGKR